MRVIATSTGTFGGTPEAGTIELAIQRLRQGSYFPQLLLEQWDRPEQALISVVVASYLLPKHWLCPCVRAAVLCWWAG